MLVFLGLIGAATYQLSHGLCFGASNPLGSDNPSAAGLVQAAYSM